MTKQNDEADFGIIPLDIFLIILALIDSNDIARFKRLSKKTSLFIDHIFSNEITINRLINPIIEKHLGKEITNLPQSQTKPKNTYFLFQAAKIFDQQKSKYYPQAFKSMLNFADSHVEALMILNIWRRITFKNPTYCESSIFSLQAAEKFSKLNKTPATIFNLAYHYFIIFYQNNNNCLIHMNRQSYEYPKLIAFFQTIFESRITINSLPFNCPNHLLDDALERTFLRFIKEALQLIDNELLVEYNKLPCVDRMKFGILFCEHNSIPLLKLIAKHHLCAILFANRELFQHLTSPKMHWLIEYYLSDFPSEIEKLKLKLKVPNYDFLASLNNGEIKRIAIQNNQYMLVDLWQAYVAMCLGFPINSNKYFQNEDNFISLSQFVLKNKDRALLLLSNANFSPDSILKLINEEIINTVSDSEKLLALYREHAIYSNFMSHRIIKHLLAANNPTITKIAKIINSDEKVTVNLICFLFELHQAAILEKNEAFPVQFLDKFTLSQCKMICKNKRLEKLLISGKRSYWFESLSASQILQINYESLTLINQSGSSEKFVVDSLLQRYKNKTFNPSFSEISKLTEEYVQSKTTTSIFVTPIFSKNPDTADNNNNENLRSILIQKIKKHQQEISELLNSSKIKRPFEDTDIEEYSSTKQKKTGRG